MCMQTKIPNRLWRKVIRRRFLCVDQVLIRGKISSNSEASEVLAIDDLSFSPGCLTVTGTTTINDISLHRRASSDLDILKYRHT